MDKEIKTPNPAETALAQDPVYQYSLFLENRVGALADVVRLLNKAGVDVLGLSLLDSVDLVVARMVLSDPDTAKAILMEKGISFAEVDLVVVELREGASELHRCLNTLVFAETNIHFVYPLLNRPSGSPLLALCVEDTEFGASALLGAGFKVLCQGDLSR